MDDRQALIDEENEERLETGAPPIPGGSAEARSHGGAVAAAIVAAVVAVILVGLVAFAVFAVTEARNTPTWVGSGIGDSNITSAPSLRTPERRSRPTTPSYGTTRSGATSSTSTRTAPASSASSWPMTTSSRATRLTARTTPRGSSGSRTAPWVTDPHYGAMGGTLAQRPEQGVLNLWALPVENPGDNKPYGSTAGPCPWMTGHGPL